MTVPVTVYHIDDYTFLFHWPNMGSGDEGQATSIWGYPNVSLQYTGTPTDVDGQPWPILDMLGTNEGPTASCWGIVRTIDPARWGMSTDRVSDPIVSMSRSKDRRVWIIKPKMRVMPEGSNRGSLMLFVSRPWGFRT